MKYLLFTSLLLSSGLSESERRLEIAQFSYATGCLQAYQVACSTHFMEYYKYKCLNMGLNTCENNSKTFKHWLKETK